MIDDLILEACPELMLGKALVENEEPLADALNEVDERECIEETIAHTTVSDSVRQECERELAIARTQRFKLPKVMEDYSKQWQ